MFEHDQLCLHGSWTERKDGRLRVSLYIKTIMAKSRAAPTRLRQTIIAYTPTPDSLPLPPFALAIQSSLKPPGNPVSACRPATSLWWYSSSPSQACMPACHSQVQSGASRRGGARGRRSDETLDHNGCLLQPQAVLKEVAAAFTSK